MLFKGGLLHSQHFLKQMYEMYERIHADFQDWVRREIIDDEPGYHQTRTNTLLVDVYSSKR
jgi:hypothetical protein